MADLKVAIEDVEEGLRSGQQVRRGASRRRWTWATLLPALVVAAFFGCRASREPENRAKW
jgi:hypothetical protein